MKTEVKTRWIDVTSGRDNHLAQHPRTGRVSIATDAIFDDGTSLRVECSGRPSDVTSIGRNDTRTSDFPARHFITIPMKARWQSYSRVRIKKSQKYPPLGGNAVEFTFDFGDSGYVAGESFGTISILEDFIAAHPEGGGDFNLTDHLGTQHHVRTFSCSPFRSPTPITNT